MSVRVDRYSSPTTWERRIAGNHSDRQRIAAISAAVGRETELLLEVGCGDGSVLQGIRAARPNALYLGLDRHVEALEAARRIPTPRTCLLVGDALRLPFADQSVDCVVCAEIMEHLGDEKLSEAAREVARVARSQIILTVPNRENLGRRMVDCSHCGSRFHLYGHMQHFNPPRLIHLFDGFSPSRVGEIGPRRNEWSELYSALWRRRWLSEERPLCPNCGSEGPLSHELRGSGGPLGALLLRSLAWVGRRRWLIAEYRRAELVQP